MGNIRRIKKQMTQPMAFADTKVAFNHCRIFLGNPNPSIAAKNAPQFAAFMNMLNQRARCVNMKDLYTAHFRTLAKMEAGEDLVKEKESG